MLMRALVLPAVAGAGLAAATPALAQDTIRIGEINSYKAQPAFLDPYRKGWELALEQVNAAGGVNGKKLEIISRDDGASPGDAVRVAEELLSRERVDVLAGGFASPHGRLRREQCQQLDMLLAERIELRALEIEHADTAVLQEQRNGQFGTDVVDRVDVTRVG